GNGNFHLQAGSLLIDTIPGAHLSEFVSTDLDGNTRPQGGGYDMGCYEYTSHPYVTIVSPADAATEVAVGSSITATFSEVMEPNSITSATPENMVITYNSGGSQVTGTITMNVSKTVATFVPDTPLAYSTTYTVTLYSDKDGVHSGIRAAPPGNYLEADYTWSFTTGAAPPPPDTTPPAVTLVFPAANATGVSRDTVVRATFSEAMAPSSLISATPPNMIITYNSGGSQVTGSVAMSVSGTVATFTPSAALAYDTTYTVTLYAQGGGHTGAQDVAGNPLASDYTWSFTTEASSPPPTPPPPEDTTPPLITSVVPDDGAADVPRDVIVKVFFSEKVLTNSVNGTSFFLSSENGGVEAILTRYGASAELSPLTPLDYGTAYTATVTTAVEDMSGNHLKDLRTWTFTTVADPSPQPPVVVTFDPPDAATGVSRNAVVTVTFSRPMDAASINGSTVYLFKEGSGSPVPGTLSVSGAVAVFTPDAPLAFDARYTITVTTGVRDLGGLSMAAAASGSFTVESAPPGMRPVIITVSPGANATGVAVGTTVTAWFSEPMDPNSITPVTFSLENGSGNPVSGTVSGSGNIATFIPSSPLAYGTSYTATITDSVMALNGARLAQPFQWPFTTVANQPPAPPVPPPSLTGGEVVFPPGPVVLSGGPFEDPEGGTLVDTLWLIAPTDRPTYENPPVSTGASPQIVLDGLLPGVEYKWMVGYVDDSGNVSWSGEYTFIVGVSGADGSVAVSSGEYVSDFEMISFVQWPDAALLEDQLFLQDPNDYRIGGYDAMTGTYIVFGNGLAIKPGMAYWLLARDGLNITMNGIPVSLARDVDISLDFNPASGSGWNMIGCPNGANYYWQEIQLIVYDDLGNVIYGPVPMGDVPSDNPYLDTRLWRWENGSYAWDTSLMEAYSGYWARARAAHVHLRFPVSAQVTLTAGSGSIRTAVAGMLMKYLLPATVSASAGDEPPAPMIDFTVPLPRVSGGGGGGGGCFIQPLLDR
ncbi:MAG: Ig-like domain-containing protein, partial [Pseudomonadota bacterium]